MPQEVPSGSALSPLPHKVGANGVDIFYLLKYAWCPPRCLIRHWDHPRWAERKCRPHKPSEYRKQFPFVTTPLGSARAQGIPHGIPMPKTQSPKRNSKGSLKKKLRKGLSKSKIAKQGFRNRRVMLYGRWVRLSGTPRRSHRVIPATLIPYPHIERNPPPTTASIWNEPVHKLIQ